MVTKNQIVERLSEVEESIYLLDQLVDVTPINKARLVHAAAQLRDRVSVLVDGISHLEG